MNCIGKVYTWGCADEGSLGREGDENNPALVSASSLDDETVIGIACEFYVILCRVVRRV